MTTKNKTQPERFHGLLNKSETYAIVVTNTGLILEYCRIANTADSRLRELNKKYFGEELGIIKIK